MLDDAEVVGIARGSGSGDALDIDPDANYAHLIATSRGNNPLLWKPDGTAAAAVEVAISQYGHKYLRTVTDFEVPNNLLSLPECPTG